MFMFCQKTTRLHKKEKVLCKFIKAPLGRKRFHVLGALNAVTHELIRVTNDTYINAQSVCDLLWRISRLNLGVPITLVLDNARDQKCKIVWELAASLDIELLYIPPFSRCTDIILTIATIFFIEF